MNKPEIKLTQSSDKRSVPDGVQRQFLVCKRWQLVLYSILFIIRQAQLLLSLVVLQLHQAQRLGLIFSVHIHGSGDF